MSQKSNFTRLNSLAAFLLCAVYLAAFSGLGMGITPAIAGEAPGLAQARSAQGLQVLRLDPTLQRVAQDQADYMAAAGVMCHNTAPGLDFSSRMIESGFGRKASENIGCGSVTDRQIVEAWLNSANHRNNMLDPGYSRYGFASAIDPANSRRRFWSMVMGR